MAGVQTPAAFPLLGSIIGAFQGVMPGAGARSPPSCPTTRRSAGCATPKAANNRLLRRRSSPHSPSSFRGPNLSDLLVGLLTPGIDPGPLLFEPVCALFTGRFVANALQVLIGLLLIMACT
jgi:TctA family transporter